MPARCDRRRPRGAPLSRVRRKMKRVREAPRGRARLRANPRRTARTSSRGRTPTPRDGYAPLFTPERSPDRHESPRTPFLRSGKERTEAPGAHATTADHGALRGMVQGNVGLDQQTDSSLDRPPEADALAPDADEYVREHIRRMCDENMTGAQILAGIANLGHSNNGNASPHSIKSEQHAHDQAIRDDAAAQLRAGSSQHAADGSACFDGAGSHNPASTLGVGKPSDEAKCIVDVELWTYGRFRLSRWDTEITIAEKRPAPRFAPRTWPTPSVGSAS